MLKIGSAKRQRVQQEERGGGRVTGPTLMSSKSAQSSDQSITSGGRTETAIQLRGVGARRGGGVGLPQAEREGLVGWVGRAVLKQI